MCLNSILSPPVKKQCITYICNVLVPKTTRKLFLHLISVNILKHTTETKFAKTNPFIEMYV